MGNELVKKPNYRVTWRSILITVLIIQSLFIKSSHPNSELFEVISAWNKLLLTKPNVLTRQEQRIKPIETAPAPIQRLRNFSKVSNTLSTDRNDATSNFNKLGYEKSYQPATSAAHKMGLPFDEDLHCLAHVGGLGLKGLKLFGIGAIKALILFKFLAFLSILPFFIPRPVLLVNVPGPSSSTSQIVTEMPLETTTTTTPTPITLPPITIPPTLPPVPDPGPVVVITCPPCFGRRRDLGFGDGGGRGPDRMMMTTTVNNSTAYLSTTESSWRNNSIPTSTTGIESLTYFMDHERCIERVLCEAKFELSGIYAWRKRKVYKDRVATFLQIVLLNSKNKSRMIGRMIFQDDVVEDKHEPTLTRRRNDNEKPSLKCELYECKGFRKIRNYLNVQMNLNGVV